MRIQYCVSTLAALALVTVSAQPLAVTQGTTASPPTRVDQSKTDKSDKGVSKEASEAIERVQSSTTVLTELTKTPDETIPSNLLAGAEGIVVIPTLVKGGFIVGAKHGRGIISVRHPLQSASSKGAAGHGTWSRPAFVKMTGGNIGWQIGLEQVDLVLLVMNKDGIDDLLSDKFTLGGNLSVAAGPVGRSGDAATDAKLQAGILSYSRAKGLFAGATLEGAALHSDDDANKAVYRGTANLKTLLLQAPPKDPMLPVAMQTWEATLQRLAKR